MFSFLRSLYQPTVDAILADFSRLITKLDAAVDFHNREATLQQSIIDDAIDLKAFDVKEADRARNVARKLEELLR